jgi:ribosomal protein L35
MRGHKLEKKSSKRKRAFGRDFEVKPGDTKSVKKMLGLH